MNNCACCDADLDQIDYEELRDGFYCVDCIENDDETIMKAYVYLK